MNMRDCQIIIYRDLNGEKNMNYGKPKKAKCGASVPSMKTPKMAMGGYMSIEKKKKPGAYGGGYMNKKKK